MCGRYYFADINGMQNISPELYNLIVFKEQGLNDVEIKPGDIAPVLIRCNNTYTLVNMEWGFKTSNGKLVINARCETIHDRKLFSLAAEDGRCVIPASGYYEWRKQDGQKFAFTDGQPLIYMAGLYRYTEEGCQFAVLTRNAVSTVSQIHTRMPLILDDRESIVNWMKGTPVSIFSDKDIAIQATACGDEQLRMPF